MHGQSRNWLFGLSTAFAVTAVAFLAWKVLDQNPRLFARSPAPVNSSANPAANPAAPSAPAPGSDMVLKGAAIGDKAGGAAISPVPSFDIVRVEPTGEAVVAGRAAPGATVRLLNKGQVIAQSKADEAGNFAIVPPPLAAGDHLLTLEADGAASRGQTVAVAVPADRKGEVVVALAEPGAATRILSDKPALKPANSVAVAPSLRIRSVEVDEKGGFYASGSGVPGSTIRLSLNGAPLATVEAGKDGGWSLKVERGMKGGAYSVRADHVDSAGKIIAQAEVPFDYPERQAAAAPAGSRKPGDSANAVVSEVRSVTVQRGDSLWRISQRVLGSGYRYTQIYAANNDQIRNPSLIFPNQVLVVPGEAKAN